MPSRAPIFILVATTLAAAAAPAGRSEVAFRLAERDLIPENVAYDPVEEVFYVGSMYKRKIVKIGPDGRAREFVPPARDGLLSVLGMKVDAKRRALWAVAGNYGDAPPMEKPEPSMAGRAAVFRYELPGGRLAQRYDRAPRPGARLWFNDLVVHPSGDVYVSAGPDGIFRIPGEAGRLEPFFAEQGLLVNGLDLSPDGRRLFLADSSRGIRRLELATRKSAALPAPPGSDLRGIDGLYFHRGGLVAIQNGRSPERIVRLRLNAALDRIEGVAVLEEANPLWVIPTTGVVVGDSLHYVGTSQLESFARDHTIWPREKLKDTLILKLRLL